MTPPPLTISVMRALAQKRVDETSLRTVADEIGKTHNWLHNFLKGRSPQAATRVKLVRWYYRRSARSSAPPKEDVDTAIAQVLGYVHDESIPRQVRDRRLREVMARLQREGG